MRDNSTERKKIFPQSAGSTWPKDSSCNSVRSFSTSSTTLTSPTRASRSRTRCSACRFRI